MHHLQKTLMNGFKQQLIANIQNTNYTITYIDIEQPIENEEHQKWAQTSDR